MSLSCATYQQRANVSVLFLGMCLEKRVFFRVISGLHTSINTHLCALYLFEGEWSVECSRVCRCVGLMSSCVLVCVRV